MAIIRDYYGGTRKRSAHGRTQGGAINDYERLVKDLLALAVEASIRGEFDEPRSADFAELGSEVYRAIFKATEDVLPAGTLEAFAEERKP
jgi:hypothetical protein